MYIVVVCDHSLGEKLLYINDQDLTYTEMFVDAYCLHTYCLLQMIVFMHELCTQIRMNWYCNTMYRLSLIKLVDDIILL